MKKNLLLFVLPVLLLCACKDDTTKKKVATTDSDTYFSIKQFAMDEWTTYAGSPFVMVKKVRLNGKSDSSFVGSDTLNWAALLKIFFASDISDKKFLGKYEFSQFDDVSDNTHSFFYQAKDDDDLFTRKLLISIDNETRKITGIYVETKSSTIWDDCSQKLYYAPMKTIQIQTYDRPLFGSKKDEVITYNFML